MPDSFEKSIIFPLQKKGNVRVEIYYRGISFMNVLGKLFTGILLKRLEIFANKNEILYEYQAGFGKGYLTRQYL